MRRERRRALLAVLIGAACCGGACAGDAAPDAAAEVGAADATGAADLVASGQDGPGASADAAAADAPVVLPLVLGGALGPDGVLQAWAEGAEVEVVQGPQGGIHVEALGRFEAAGLADAIFVALLGRVTLDGAEVASLDAQRYTVLRDADGAYTTRAVPIIFSDWWAGTYLGDPPQPTPAVVCLTVDLGDGRAASDCRTVTLVDLL